ncbi:hypothetical protein KCU95_g13640, partial [Aureobasidium melanogenum]
MALSERIFRASRLYRDAEDYTDALVANNPNPRNGAQKEEAKRTAAGIPTWSPTVVLICRSTAYVWQSGRDAQFSVDCGRTCSTEHC